MAKQITVFGEILHDTQLAMFRYFYGEEAEVATPKLVLGQLKEAKGEDIELLINSPGGSADGGVAIANLLDEYEGEITAKIIGMAASAGTVVAMGANEIEIANNAGMMVHGASIYTFGAMNIKDNEELGKALQNYNERIAITYANKTGDPKDKERFLQDLNSGEDIYLTAEEALAMKLVDRIGKKSEAAVNYDPKVNASLLKEAPASFRNRLETYREKQNRIQNEQDQEENERKALHSKYALEFEIAS